jgi:FAD/FMN-containing dehydrogenase
MTSFLFIITLVHFFSTYTTLKCHYPIINNSLELCNYQSSVVCRSKVFLPRNESEIIDIVKSNRRSTIRVVGRPHSDTSTLLCGSDVTLMTTHLDTIFGLQRDIVHVQAGVQIHTLNDYLDRNDRALAALYPAYSGLTVAGVIGSAAHLSSLTMPSALADAVTQIKIVDKNGDSFWVSQNDLPFYRSSLGSLGIITELKLKTIPQYDLIIKSTYQNSNWLFNGEWVCIIIIIGEMSTFLTTILVESCKRK